MVRFTHKGWFGVVPVKIAGLDTDAPNLDPRFGLPYWLVDLQAFIYIACSYTLPGDWQFPIRVTGRLEN